MQRSVGSPAAARPIVLRFIWIHTGTALCHWEQAFSADDGASSEVYWTMDFTRIGEGNVPRYSCQGGNINHGAPRCISFGGLRVDDVIARELLSAIAPEGISAAIRAAEIALQGDQTRKEALVLELEAARYQALLRSGDTKPAPLRTA